jgi:hypothetical protein
VTGPQPRHRESARTGATLDHDAALASAGRVFVTAHPAEPATSVVLRAGEAALTTYAESATGAWALHPVADTSGDPEAAAVDRLRRLFAAHLRERLPDEPAGELHAAVAAAAVVAALDLALAGWLAAGARADGVAACQERFRAVAPLLPPDP